MYWLDLPLRRNCQVVVVCRLALWSLPGLLRQGLGSVPPQVKGDAVTNAEVACRLGLMRRVHCCCVRVTAQLWEQRCQSSGDAAGDDSTGASE